MSIERDYISPYADTVMAEKTGDIPPKVAPEADSEDIELTMDDLTEVNENELAKTVAVEQIKVPYFKAERSKTPKEERQQLQTPEERAAKERHDIEDLIFDLGEIRGREVPKNELLQALHDGIGFLEVMSILGSPDAARKLPQEKRKALIQKIGELALIKFLRNPKLGDVMKIQVPELPDNPEAYRKKLRDEIRNNKFKSLEQFFDQLDMERYALEGFFDVQVSNE